MQENIPRSQYQNLQTLTIIHSVNQPMNITCLCNSLYSKSVHHSVTIIGGEQPNTFPAALNQGNEGALPAIYSWIRYRPITCHVSKYFVCTCQGGGFYGRISWSTGDGVGNIYIQLSRRNFVFDVYSYLVLPAIFRNLQTVHNIDRSFFLLAPYKENIQHPT